VWVGNIIAKEVGLYFGPSGDKLQVKSILAYMLKEGFFNIVQNPYGTKGKTAPFVEIGTWVDAELASFQSVGLYLLLLCSSRSSSEA